MKKLSITVGIFCLNFIAVFSQEKINLQPKEPAKTCSFGEIAFASGYSNANDGTTDLFTQNEKKRCGDTDVPTNYMGNQEPAEGDNYFGIITYKGDHVVDWKAVTEGGLEEGKDPEDRFAEYIQVAVPQQLIAGKDYEINFKVSLADNSAFATKGFGVYLSDATVHQKGNERLTVEPQISFPNLVVDKTNWVELKGRFKATGNEKYAVIGCFDKNYSVEQVGEGKSLGSKRAYYYVSSIAINEAPIVSDDKDKDGFADAVDNCPDVAGTVKGCPDADSDGIADINDKCPKLVGLENNFGCPEIFLYYKREVAELNAEDKADCDKVINFLNNHPDVNITISSYTSTPGEAEYNQKLSEKRANNTADYLVSKGIDRKRLTTKGYGEQFPIGDNTTEQGRAQSRRSVITITK